MKILIKTIPHSEQRYDTVGDWFERDGVVHIRVSEAAEEQHAFVVALHELVEWYACKDAGVTEQAVDAFDMAFTGEGEPGDDPRAPYYKQHQFATGIERLMAIYLGIDWKAYEQGLAAL
jgi:hypothetical protein